MGVQCGRNLSSVPYDSLVGRKREIELICAGLKSNRPVLLVGPPGTSKTSILQTIANELAVHKRLFQITGDDQLSVHALVGTFDPVNVMRTGYKAENFDPGPLTRAMQSGGILYVEELNRTPSSTLNALLTALSDGYLDVPRFGRVSAVDGFGFVASSNPLDDVGTERMSRALLDRFVSVSLSYQTPEDERKIVHIQVPEMQASWVTYAVELVQRTRHHPDLRFGSSIRGAIDFLKMLVHVDNVEEVIWDVGVSAFATKVAGRSSVSRPVGDIILEIMREVPFPRDFPVVSPWMESKSPPNSDTQGGARVRVNGEKGDSRSGRNGELQGSASSSITSIDMALQGGEGGTRGRSQVKPLSFSQLKFGVTRDEGTLGEKRLTPWIVLDDVKKIIRAQYRPLKTLKKSPIPAPLHGYRLVPYVPGAVGELDVTASLDQLALVSGMAIPSRVKIRKPNWSTRKLCLFLDNSGSMVGPKLQIAVILATLLSVHSLNGEVQFGVYVFDQEVSVLQDVGRNRPLSEIVEDILHLPEGRSTDLSRALRYAIELADKDAEMEIVLVSDCMPTRGEKTFDSLARYIQQIPKLFIVHLPHERNPVFDVSVDKVPRMLDLYGLWAMKWVGPHRFVSIGDMEELGQLIEMLSQRGDWL